MSSLVGFKGVTSGAEMESGLFGVATKSAKGVVIFNVSEVMHVAAARVNSCDNAI